MEITVHSTEETQKLAQQIAKTISPGDIIALYGDLGSGKTTFTRFLVEALGVKARVQSPTFIIHRIYSHDNILINHFDLYRLQELSELEDMGFGEILEDTSSISIIEWPEVADNLLLRYSKRLKKIYFKYINQTDREIEIL